MTFSNPLSGNLPGMQAWVSPKTQGMQQLFEDLKQVESSFPHFQQFQENRDSFIRMVVGLNGNN